MPRPLRPRGLTYGAHVGAKEATWLTYVTGAKPAIGKTPAGQPIYRSECWPYPWDGNEDPAGIIDWTPTGSTQGVILNVVSSRPPWAPRVGDNVQATRAEAPNAGQGPNEPPAPWADNRFTRPLAPTRGSLDEKVTYAGDYLDTTTKLVGLGVLGYIFVAYVAPTFLGGATKTRSAYAHYKAAKKLPGHETASMSTVSHAALEGPLGRRFPARIGPHT